MPSPLQPEGEKYYIWAKEFVGGGQKPFEKSNKKA